MANATITRTHRAALGAWTLIVGGVAFGAFWGLAPTSIDESWPWVVGLSIHGIGIVTLFLGLGSLWFAARHGPSFRVVTVGAALAVLGLMTLFPLLPAGLALVAWGLGRDGWPRVACSTLLAGATSLFAITIARFIVVGGAVAGDEGAPSLSVLWGMWFEVSIALVAVGLVLLGRSRLR